MSTTPDQRPSAPLPESGRERVAPHLASGEVVLIETKGREELDLPQKMRRLKEWCADATAASKAIGGPEYRHLFVDQAGFERHTPRDFAGLAKAFREFQE